MRSNRIFATAVALILIPALTWSDEPERPRKFEESKRADLLRRARFVRHSANNRPNLDSKRLTAMGAVPQFSLRVGNATLYLSKPFALDESHQVAVALVEVNDSVWARVLYRSNSQFSWRLCDALSGNHIGKGFHEFDKQMPIPVTVALMRLADDIGTLKAVDTIADSDAGQHDIASQLLRGLTIDFRSERTTGRVIEVFGTKYCTREYAAQMPIFPIRFSVVKEHLPTPNGGQIANPSQTKLPPDEKLPDFKTLVDSFQYTNTAFAKVSGDKGLLTGKVFLSRDQSVRYLFYEDWQGRASLAGVEALHAAINRFGLRSRYFDVAGMDAPLMEYKSQIPEQFGGSDDDSGYRLNWRYVREQPIIKQYYEQQQRKMPAGEPLRKKAA